MEKTFNENKLKIVKLKRTKIYVTMHVEKHLKVKNDTSRITCI